MGKLTTMVGGMALLIGLAAPAHAEPDQDDRFALLLADNGLDLSYFQEYKQHALEVCQRIANGEQAGTIYYEASKTGASLGDELAIISAGIAVYCS